MKGWCLEMSWKVLYEPFQSYSQLLETLADRKNNKIMSDCHSSNRRDDKWFGTRNYTEATKMLINGYGAVVDKLHRNVVQASKINSKFVSDIPHPMPQNNVFGFVPNVPAAIQNLPKAMIFNDRKPLKKKTLHIIYGVGGSCSESQSYFEDAGVALLSAVDLIEKCGIQTKIDLAFFLSYSGDEFPLPTICIKNYGERFSIQKVSFPLVHTSMFRRIGFKWLETTPLITRYGFKGGYGFPPNHAQSEEAVRQVLGSDGEYISNDWINCNGCSVESILKKLGVLV